MGDRRWLKIGCLHIVDDRESKRLKVSALNLFRPTASPFSEKASFSFYDTAYVGRGEGRGWMGDGETNEKAG